MQRKRHLPILFNNKFQLKGFTVIELMITMTILGVIVTMVYHVFNSFNQQYYTYKNGQEVVSEALLFEEVLTRDLYLSKSIVYENDELTIHDGAVEKKYLFKNFGVIRNTTTSDTFDLKVFKVDYELKNNDKKYIHNFKIKTNKEEEVTFFFKKEVSIANKVNKEFLDEY